MSFTGDLEHLPIVDIIQLLHTTRKSGILRVRSRKGESDLVFKDGYIVSASHLNNSVRIGTILVERKIITDEILNQTLLEQKNAGAGRKPLIISLLEKGLVKDEDAYKGLEHLIELTIVEILTWKSGTFMMEVLPDGIVDDYRYYPGKMDREINVDAQGVLMDALCVFDERMRDGELEEVEVLEVDGAEPGPVQCTAQGTVTGSASVQGRPAHSADPAPKRLGVEHPEREEKREQYPADETWWPEAEPEPRAPDGTVTEQELGWGSIVVGLIVAGCGIKGLYDYGQIRPAEGLGIEEPPGPLTLYLAHGLLPTLQALLGMGTAFVGSQLLKMRPGARRWLEAVTWSGIVFVVASEMSDLIAAIRRAFSLSFWYCLVHFMSFILMTTLWTAPLLAAVWYLRRDARRSS